jgi:hypothetical protein
LDDAARFENVDNYFRKSFYQYVAPHAQLCSILDPRERGVFVDDNRTSVNELLSIHPDLSFSSLLQDILYHGGNLAHALSSLITVQAGSTYYDQPPQLDGRSKTEQTFFEPVLTLQQYRGYIVVVAVASAHLILVIIILFQFLTSTKISTIGNAWQTLAQIKHPWTEELLDLNKLSSDRGVNLWMKRNADGQVVSRLSDSIEVSSNEGEERELPSGLKPSDFVGIRLASSGIRTELVYR